MGGTQVRKDGRDSGEPKKRDETQVSRKGQVRLRTAHKVDCVHRKEVRSLSSGRWIKNGTSPRLYTNCLARGTPTVWLEVPCSQRPVRWLAAVAIAI
eukprot:scaffold187043_cov17-Tisochrysis_lutea.AAC.2